MEEIQTPTLQTGQPSYHTPLRYKIVGIFNLLSGLFQIVVSGNFIIFVIPQLNTLYENIQVPYANNILLAYIGFAIILILGVASLFVGIKLLIKSSASKRYFITGIVLFVLFLLSGGGYGVLIVSTIQPIYNLTGQIDLEQTITPTPDPKANWKTYMNTKHGYTFKYPSMFVVSDSNDPMGDIDTTTISNYTRKDYSSGRINPDDSNVFLMWIVNDPSRINIDFETAKKYYGFPKVQIEDSIIGGVKGFRVINGGTYVIFNNKEYRFHLRNEKSKYANYFDQILSTFKFLDETNKTDPRRACINAEGRWLAEYSECESSDTNKGLSQVTCTQLGGQYDECESTCRHNPNAQVCITVCVGVCRFN